MASMGSMKFLTLPGFAFGLLLLLLCGCAQISSPTGGPIDEDPPRVLKMSPASDQINVRPTSLRILFDEFVALKNPQQQLVISPPISKKPTFRIKGKEVRIELDYYRPNVPSTDEIFRAIQRENRLMRLDQQAQ